MSRMMVSAEVICGVTERSSTASLNCTVMVLFATTWTGKVTPCLISAALLFWVMIFGAEMIRTCPRRSAAEIAASMLKAPEMLPRERPTAPVGAPANGRFTA